MVNSDATDETVQVNQVGEAFIELGDLERPARYCVGDFAWRVGTRLRVLSTLSIVIFGRFYNNR